MRIESIKQFLRLNPNLLCNLYNFLNVFNITRIKSHPTNNLNYYKAFLRRTSIHAKSKNNIIHILPSSYLNNCSIAIYGENNKVTIGEGCSLRDVEIHIEDNNNEIRIGRRTTIAGTTHLACIEGTKISIGNDCMFSKDITFRTGDSHSIVNLEGERINPSKDINIGNHVWVGNRVILTKGTKVSDNSVIGTGSIVSKNFEEPNIVIAGVPAKKVNENINWLRERI